MTLRNVSKTFPGTVALDGVDLDLFPGEVHALVGENGSGKSTLVKVLTGYHSPDPGAEIGVAGERLALPTTPRHVRALGLAFVHQSSALFPGLTVLENLALARGYARATPARVSWKRERKRALADLELVGLPVSPQALVRDLDSCEAKLVEIARALSMTAGGGRVLVVDEPTAALPKAEIDRLFEAIRRLTVGGLATLYISHRLDEVLELGTRVTVLRNGCRVWTRPVVDVDLPTLVRAISGHGVPAGAARSEARPAGEDRLVVRSLSARNVTGITFAVTRGEIVGIGGALGSGGSEIGRCLAGAQPVREGTIEIDGEEVTFASPQRAIRAGVFYVGSDRQRHSAFPRLTLRENVGVANVRTTKCRGTVSRRRERVLVREVIERFDIRPPIMERRFATYSGGNQQKAILGRWLTVPPRVLVLDEPTQGVDVAARAAIHEILRGVAAEGSALVVVSSDFKELAELCDRVLVLRNGRVAATCSDRELVPERMQALAHEG